jgi:uncharacterized protein with NRDE domain
MCLLVLAWNAHPRYRVVLAANRDEFHQRPAAALAWWPEPRMLAGRDLQAGGTWLAIGPDARFGVITNYRDMQGPLPGTPSRGQLIPDFLGSSASALEYPVRLVPGLSRYSGFNLLIGDAKHLYYVANRAEQPTRELPAGVHGLSNHLLDTPWPKLVRTRARFERLLCDDRLSPDALLAILTDRSPSQEYELPGSGLPPDIERVLSAPFIVNERYGTRSSTILVIGHDGAVAITEQRYDARGELIGRASFEFQS